MHSSFEPVCDICHFSKQHKLPFTHSDTNSLNTFDLIHTDIWQGPVNILFVHGYRYFLTIVDDYTRDTWVYLMKVNSETGTLLHNFATYVKNQFGLYIKTIRSDNGKKICLQYCSQ